MSNISKEHNKKSIGHNSKNFFNKTKKITIDDNYNEKILNYAFFKHSNKFKTKEGRPYEYIDKNGQYVSSHVSPYSPFIEKNIDPGVLDLVILLINKGYLTCSSCEGHSDRKFRYVTIAFNTFEQLNNFKKNILKSKVPLNFRISNKKNQAWHGHNITYNYKNIENKKLSVQEFIKLSEKITEEDFVKYHNIMFLRNYTQYYLLQIRIASFPENNSNFLGIVKTIFEYPYYYIIYKFKNYFTKKLIKYINVHVKDYEDKI
jgi:hypothetical protein